MGMETHACHGRIIPCDHLSDWGAQVDIEIDDKGIRCRIEGGLRPCRRTSWAVIFYRRTSSLTLKLGHLGSSLMPSSGTPSRLRLRLKVQT